MRLGTRPRTIPIVVVRLSPCGADCACYAAAHMQPVVRRGPMASQAQGITCARCSTAWASTTRRLLPFQVTGCLSLGCSLICSPCPMLWSLPCMLSFWRAAWTRPDSANGSIAALVAVSTATRDSFRWPARRSLVKIASPSCTPRDCGRGGSGRHPSVVPVLCPMF